MNKRYFFLLFLFFHLNYGFAQSNDLNLDSPKISFTFDDGDTSSYPNYPLKKWNARLLKTLKKHELKAILYTHGKNKTNALGKYILTSWNKNGHLIGNHSFAHKNYSSEKATFEWFKQDFLKNDSLINAYDNYAKIYRFPYLKEGNTREKIDSARAFFQEQGYRNGYVTIDASDWYVNARLIKVLKTNNQADLNKFKEFYINHLYDRAMFYDSLATVLTGRKIAHTLLLHHNLAAALFLDDLILHFKVKGWTLVNADEALKDEIYNELPSTIPCGESIIWNKAKESGNFEHLLRYPPEDGEYEKEKMDKLGL
jgi:peptidoglycan/xylan/chitin deacetylase (PgdA/CDA1 family)